MSVATLRPRRIGSQIALVMIAAVLLAHLLTFGVASLFRPGPPPVPPPVLDAVRIAALVELARAPEAPLPVVPPAWRLRLTPLPAAPQTVDARPPGGLAELVRSELGPRTNVLAVPAAGEIAVAISLPHGRWLQAAVTPEPPPGPGPGSIWFWLRLLAPLAAALVAASWWVSRRLARPLHRFAAALDGLRPDEDGAALPETGPLELRRCAAAVNRLKERIGLLVAERSRMLAAIGHDLRAPLARLRLRVEGLRPSPERDEIERDLRRMEVLLASALAYLRGRAVAEPSEPVDLPSLIQTVLDRHHDLGQAVGYRGPDHLVHDCRPLAMERALDNLIANATLFAGTVEVALRPADAEIVIEVIDDGPGIPPQLREQMMAPFVRGDSERDPSRAGLGLGLSIVAELARGEGGELELDGRLPRGLVARLRLPAGTTATRP